ncbi:MAG: hypothetical protein OHK0046_49910 [Anaerolineae bacterium]
MRFVLFTEKSIAQCMREMNERLEAKPTKARPELHGWIEKGGSFSVSMTTKIFNRFPRSTRLSAKAQRENGMTVIRGYVSDGLGPYWLRVMTGAVALVALLLLVAGEPMLTLITLLFGAVAYVPLRGDYINSDLLLLEVERTLKASPTPPKASSAPKTTSAPKAAATAKTAAPARSTTTAKAAPAKAKTTGTSTRTTTTAPKASTAKPSAARSTTTTKASTPPPKK